MEIKVPKGKYVLAVSGGVDSMVLLDLLARKPGVELIVAHFNHNIRENSIDDELLVKQAASKYGLIFEARQGALSRNASEATARTARYAFLRGIKNKYQAGKIITAHHQDDMIETALINLIRGTNRSGLSSIINSKQVLRPLLAVSKAEILAYARLNGINWHEDTTNDETKYLRNHLRLKVLKKLKRTQRDQLISNIEKVAKLSTLINDQIAILSQTTGKNTIDRQLFSTIPTSVGDELIVHYLKQQQIADFDSKTISRLNIAIRTSKNLKSQSVKHGATLELTANTAQFVTP